MGTGILEANKAVVMGLVEAINEHRLDRLPAVLASDVGAHNMIIYGEPDRPGAAFEALRQTLTAFPDLHVRVDDLIAEGDGVVARITQSGTNTGVHAPGRRFENEAIWIFTVVGGKVTEIRAVADRMTMLTRLGVLPEPGRPRRIPNV